MATSSISADVTAANSKLAEFLRRQEEEEMILQIGKRKPKKAREERLPGGSGRWQLEPDWKAPTPMVDRPRTTAGSTSFHFSYTSISKQAVPTVGGEPVGGKFGKVRNPALDHSKYIEREGAAEHSQGAEHADYIERDGAAERIDPSALMSEGVERTIAAVINETPTSEEAELLGLPDVAPEGIPSVFSNISDDPFERQEFWRAVERCEREPKSHQIIFEPDISPAWWRELETTNLLDPDFKAHALKVAEAHRQFNAQAVADGEVRKPFEAQPMPVSAEKAGRFIQQAQRMAAYRDHAPPFEFKSGRGGRIQFRMVAELPHELTAEDRALIVQNFCDHLATLQERRQIDGTPYKTGMMYTAVVHAPDAHNDSRNYHLHVVAYDRPCRYLPEHGQWDFEVQERFNHKGQDRIRFPHRQAKIEEASRPTENGDLATTGKNFVPGLRAKFAEINNAVLKARGVRRTLDPRRYTEMGIDRTPTQHLGTKAAALEAIGVPTAVGQLNAIAIWSDAERAIRRQAVQATKTYESVQDKLDALAKAMTAHDPQHPSMLQFRSLIAERERLIRDVAEDREAIMTFDHMEAKAKSRAVRTRQTCLQFLADIEAGRADRNTRAMRLVIQDRWKGAQAHINSIDKALAPHRDALAAAARDIEIRERRILEIDTKLEPIRAVLESRLEGQAYAATPAKPKGSKAAQEAPAAASTIAPPAATKDPASEAEKRASAKASPQVTDKVANDLPKPQAGAAKAEADQLSSAKTDAPGSAPATPEHEGRPDVEATQSVEPASIEGLPIVEPTIAPRQDIPAEEIQAQAGTPEGLNPLRPIEEPKPVAAEPEVVASDLDKPVADSAPSLAATDQGAAPAGPNTVETTASSSSTSQEASKVPDGVGTGPSPAAPAAEPEATPEPKVDGRKKVADPALFDLPVQEPPVKPGTSKAAYVDFDNLIKWIMDERIPIKVEKQPNGTLKFTVPSLAPAQQELLANDRFAHRANQRLGAILEKQKQEVQRVIRWISTQGQISENLRLNDGTAGLSTGVKDSVRNLFRHWGKHEDVRAALRAEYERRMEQAKAEEEAKAKKTPERIEADKDAEEKRKEAERIYPDPSQVINPLVKEFTRLLRELAPADQLREAADKIYQDPFARSEVNKHTVFLATAYQAHHEGVDQRLAQQRQRDVRGKGR